MIDWYINFPEYLVKFVLKTSYWNVSTAKELSEVENSALVGQACGDDQVP